MAALQLHAEAGSGAAAPSMKRAPRHVAPGRAKAPGAPTVIDRVMDDRESSLLDVLDHVLNKGVMATGDLTLGVAGIDLIYVRLSALLCAADRVLPGADAHATQRKAPRASRAQSGGRRGGRSGRKAAGKRRQ
jgi:hypothetical protein